MKKRKLGSLDFQVSPVSFGGASISSEGRGYSFGYISEKDAIALLRKAYDRGISLFDTAPIYGHGVSETRMGTILEGHSGLELALGFVLRHPEVSTALCGIRSEEQLDSVMAA